MRTFFSILFFGVASISCVAQSKKEKAKPDTIACIMRVGDLNIYTAVFENTQWTTGYATTTNKIKYYFLDSNKKPINTYILKWTSK